MVGRSECDAILMVFIEDNRKVGEWGLELLTIWWVRIGKVNFEEPSQSACAEAKSGKNCKFKWSGKCK